MIASVFLGAKEIPFKVVYSGRKTLGITVHPDLQVSVKAPFQTPLDEIKKKVQRRAGWIVKQQGYFLSFQPKNPARKYKGGETHLYLGRQYRLKIVPGKNEEARFNGRFIEVETTDKNHTRKLLEEWYLRQAKNKFVVIAEPLISRFRKYKVEPSSVLLRQMPARWGSCTPNGKIILNPELVKAPKGCIEYVIIHELCHLIHRDHTPKFLELQTKEMPDWEKWKTKLEKLLA